MKKKILKNTKSKIHFLLSIFTLLILVVGITTYFKTYGDIINEFENDPNYIPSGINNNQVIVNELESDYYYYKSLNYTDSNGTLPTTENKNIYNENNLVQMKITYSSIDGEEKGYVSLDERQDTYIYFKMHPVNDNGTTDKTDDYVLLELIDNPFTDRPKDKGFNGWYTTYQGTKLIFNVDYYERYIKIPVTYENDKPKKIEIELKAKWTKANIQYINSNFNTAINNLNAKEMHKLETTKVIYGEVDMSGYYYQEQFTRGDSIPSGYYDDWGDTAPSTCNPYRGQTCTYYKLIENENFDENKTYYYLRNSGWYSRMTELDNSTIERPIISEGPDEALIGANMSTYFEQVELSNGTSLDGYYTTNGTILTNGTCTSTTCTYYKLLNYYKDDGTEEEFDSNKDYYYMVTRDTNIIVLNQTMSGSWSNNGTYPFTITSLHNQTRYNVTWNANAAINCYGDTRIENVTLYYDQTINDVYNPPSSTRTAGVLFGNYNNVKIGRGLNQNGNYPSLRSVVAGNASNIGSNNNPRKYKFILESGIYNSISLTAGGILNSAWGSSQPNVYIKNKSIYGNDYDKATGNNTNLDIYFCASGSWGGNIYATTNTRTSTDISLDLIVKSGTFGSSKDDLSTGIYVGGRYGGNHYSSRRGKIEGGYIYNLIGGPLTGSTRGNVNDIYIYMTGGTVDMITGGAGTTATYGNRIVSVTGGKVNYSVFGGSNGATGTNGDGTLNGTTYIYIGGKAQIGDENLINTNSTLYGAESGSVFGIGNGRTEYETIGSCDNSIIIIDDKATIKKNIYGGGNYGATGISSTSNTSYTKIIINDGLIEGSVYGGGNKNGSGSSSKTATINITMNKGNILGSLYGGSNEKGTIYGSVNINVNGGEVTNSVYGGGRGGYTNSSNPGTFVRDNVKVVIGDKNINVTPIINTSVYGGSAFGTVNGAGASTNVSSSKVEVIVNKGIITNVFGGGEGDATYTPGVLGDIEVTINGGTITNTFGGNDKSGKPNGNITVTINDGTITNVYGGGNETSANTTNVYLNGGTTTKIFGGSNNSGDVTQSNVKTTGGKCEVLYGGNNQGGTTGITNVLVEGGEIKTVYGGGDKTSVNTSANVNIKSPVETVFGGSNLEGTIPVTNIQINNTKATNVYGGNNQGGTSNETNVDINGIYVENLYGGGLKAETTRTNLNINYGIVKNAFGGGNEAGAETTNINLKNASIINLFGGSNTSGTVNTSNIKNNGTTSSNLSATFEISESNINQTGTTGHKASEKIKTKITNKTGANLTKWNLYIITSPSIFDSNWSSTNVSYENNVYYANETNQWYGTNTLNNNQDHEFEFNIHSYDEYENFKIYGYVIVGTDANGNQYTTGLLIDKSYGGNNLGGSTINANINLTAGNINTLYGGGKKAETTNATTNVSNVTINEGIYGGGDAAPVQKVIINITSSVIGNENKDAVVYGGGNSADVNEQLELIVNKTTIYGTVYGGGNAGAVNTVAKTTITESNISKNIFGGGNQASVQKTELNISNNTIVEQNIYAGGNLGEIKEGTISTIQDSTIKESIFGGGNKAMVTKDAILNITKVNAKNIYGGGDAAGLKGNTEIKIKESNITNAVYGGGNGENSLVEGDTSGEQNPAKIYGNTKVETDNKTTIKTIYGGGNAAIVEGNTNVYVSGTTITNSIYAGGNGVTAIVYGNTNLDIDNLANITNHVFGGGNAAATGRESVNNSKGIVNIVGATIGGNVYGGANTSRLYGETTVNIGTNVSTNQNLIKSDIQINGTVFGGGEANASGSEEYDYSFISVTKGIEININAKDHNNFTIKGSIFGSGNASSTTGYSYINIYNYGTKTNIKENISIQRADIVSLNNSFIELKGATDRTNEYSTVLFSLSRIDELKLINNTSLYLQNGSNLVKKLVSLNENNEKGTVDLTNGLNRNTNNRLYMLEGKNLNIATNENVTAFGEVSGMTFFGMYLKSRTGEIVTALYSDFKPTDDVSSGDIYYFTKGSYVLGLHKTNHNIEEDGFYTNYANEEGTGIEIKYIEPTPDAATFYMWMIGEKVDSYEITLTASKYSTLGAYELSLLNHASANTTFSILGANFAGLEQNIKLIEYDKIPRIASTTEEANTIFGLNMKSGQNGWITKGSTDFLTEGSAVSGTKDYKRENSSGAPSLVFYFYHSKNITETKNLGAVTISLVAITPIDDLNNEVKRININVNLSTALYNTNDYEGTISPGKQYEMFATSSTNITSKSSFSTYYSLYITSETSPYKTGYHRSIVSTYLYPVNTEITMIDFHVASKPVYYYYVVNETDFVNQQLEYNTYGEVSYDLSKFIKMGSTSSNNNYNDEISNNTYYNNGAAEEEFIFMVDFKDTNITENVLEKSLLIELRNDENQTLISVLGIEQSTLLYNLYVGKDATIELDGNLSANTIYRGENTNLDLNIKFTQEKLNSNTIYDTNYDDQRLGIKISIYDSNNNLLSNSSLMGVNYTYDGNIYYPRYDGTTRINLAERVANLAPRLKISTANSNLATGEYRIVIESFGSPDGIYYGLESSDRLELNLNVIDNIYGLKVSTRDDTMFIDKKTGFVLDENNAFPFKVEHVSGLANPNTTIKLARRSYETVYTTEYNVVDLKDYVTNQFPIKKTNEYVLSTNPGASTDYYLYFKEGLLSGTYKIIISLYDGDNYIGEVYQYIIIK